MSLCYPESPFWRDIGNGTETGSHDSVDLTLCFQDTVILTGICVSFWLLAIITFIFTDKNIPQLPFNWLNISKIILCCLLGLPLSCSLLYYTAKTIRDDRVSYYLFISPVLLSITMVWVGVLVGFHRKRGVRSSGLLIILWICLVAYGSVKLRTLVLTAEDNNGVPTDRVGFSFFIVQYIIIVIQMILSFIPEKMQDFYNRLSDSERKPCPEESAPFFSLITWWWLNRLIWKGFRGALSYDDLYDLNGHDKSEVVAPKFQREWDKQVHNAGLDFVGQTEDTDEVRVRRKKNPSLVMAIVKAYGFTFFVAGIFKVGQDLLSFVSPQILKLIIEYVSDESQPAWKGYLYAVALFLVVELRSILLHQYFHRCYTVGMRIRGGLIAAIYRKALRLSNKSRQTKTVGEIVTLMSVDAQRFMDLVNNLHIIWSGPMQIVLALIFLYLTMGFSIFAGLGVIIILVPINVCIANVSRRFQAMLMARKDRRMKLLNEVFNGIKIIKLYAWEAPFIREIMRIRKREIKVLRKSFFFNASISFTWLCAPFTVTFVTFITYSIVNRHNPDQQLTAERAFVALALFNILRFPFTVLPTLIPNIVQASVSVKRMSSYLKSEELDPNNTNRRDEPAVGDEESVSVTGGSFTWDTPERPALHNIDLSVKGGELVAVVGPVGAGKSSLISALLGEMDKLNGQVVMKGSVAYVPQQAWIQNATVKDNILFGKPLNPILYGQTVQSCALETDLEILPGGDMTEIGEKGINLSGGQKQRVSLARAVYQESDVYLLDDPLSAVDSHVGKHIFDKVIGPEGVLKGKVRILVTHGIGFLSQCDKIIVMSNGRITEVGSYNELIEQNGTFAELLHNYGTTKVNEDGDEEKRYSSSTDFQGDEKTVAIEAKEDEEHKKKSSFLTGEEKVKSGNIRLSVLNSYIKSCTYYISLLITFFYMLSSGAAVSQNVWLAHWSNTQDNNNNDNDSFNNDDLALNLGVYGLFGVLQAAAVLGFSFSLAIGSLKASVKLHDGMLSNILRSPMSFFDTTPLGRILNRFSKDINIIDEGIPRALNTFLRILFQLLATVIIISIASPWFVIVIVPMIIFYGFVQRFYVATSRQLKRLESSSRSPIYSHFQESISGASSIRAYSKVDQFQLQSEERVDYNQIAYYPNVSADRWLGIRLEFLGNLVIFFTALFAALQRNYPQIFGHINGGLTGLSVSYGLEITSCLNCIVRMASQLETNIVAVERTKEYSETPTEAADIIPDHRVPTDWPVEGRVQFDHYSTRYRPGLDLVLKDISCNIPGGQKVGIVGRTGAGKSSLTVALFRIIESAQGAILIDGVDISTYGLSDLRSHITIIPQDPVLFSGTLRINLDPFNSHTDDDVWRALETAHLSEFVGGLAEGLEYPVAEGGENLSVGQRQLVCLARALLRKTKILVLDEATAAVDLETDDLIQKTIRKEFAGCTVLTIAHRLNTIMDYDKIMVLDDGHIVEFDSPNKLIAQEGKFYSLVKDAKLL